jgi:hypothetical protein
VGKGGRIFYWGVPSLPALSEHREPDLLIGLAEAHRRWQDRVGGPQQLLQGAEVALRHATFERISRVNCKDSLCDAAVSKRGE